MFSVPLKCELFCEHATISISIYDYQTDSFQESPLKRWYLSCYLFNCEHNTSSRIQSITDGVQSAELSCLMFRAEK
jgi:hypothetical protein